MIDVADPAWWAVLGGGAVLDAIATRRGGPAPYLASDAEPHGDTFMGWPAPPPRDLAHAIADAVLAAAAASAAIAELDGTLPDQPLAVAIATGARAARPVWVDPRRVRFAVAGRRLAVRLSGEPDDLLATARAVARAARGERVGDGTGPAAIAAVVGDHDPSIARHLHRAAWDDGGGPWLGVGRAGELALATTCHLVVDGYGHALLASRIARAGDDLLLRARLAAAAIVGDAPVPEAAPLARAEPLGVAWARLPAPLPRFADLAHALGRTLWEEAGDPRAPFSPVIQVPVARGARDDAQRWRRRVVHALLSVRFPDGAPEALDAFAARVRDVIAREVDGGGLLTRLIGATAALPVPLAWKRRRVAGVRSARFDGPLEVLAGRSAFSLLRLQPGDAPPAPPLVAVSAPGRMLDGATHGGRSTSVLTVVADATGATATVAGSGAAGTAQGARALLDRWLAATSTPASGSAGARASRSGPSS